MTLAEKLQRRSKLVKQQRELHVATKTKIKVRNEAGAEVEQDGHRSMTDVEQSQYDANKRELDMLGVEIQAEERESNIRLEELRRVLGPNAMPTDENGPFRTLGEQLRTVREAAQGSAEARSRLLEVRAPLGNNTVVDSEGGFLLQPQFQQGLYQRAYSTGQILPRVQSVPIGAAANSIVINAPDDKSLVNGSVMGGIIAYWAAQAGTATGTKPTFRQIKLSLEKLLALCYATDEMLADTTVLESVINQGVPTALRLKAEQAMISGTGAGQCLGILNSGALIKVAKQVGQPSATIVYENVLDMWTRMHADSAMDAVWFINQACFPQLAKMSLVVGVGGVPVWMPATGASGSPFSTLFGRPVIPIPYCSALGTVGDIIFADFGQYLSINKGGIQSVSSIHVAFLTSEVAYRFTYRLNGQPLWDAAFTPLANDQTYSPFVALDNR